MTPEEQFFCDDCRRITSGRCAKHSSFTVTYPSNEHPPIPAEPHDKNLTIAALRGEVAKLTEERRVVLTSEQLSSEQAVEAEAALADLRGQLEKCERERDSAWGELGFTKNDLGTARHFEAQAREQLDAVRGERDALVQQLEAIRLLAESQKDHTDDAVATRFSEIEGLATLTPPPAPPVQESATCPACGRTRAWTSAGGFVCCYTECSAHTALTLPSEGKTK